MHIGGFAGVEVEGTRRSQVIYHRRKIQSVALLAAFLTSGFLGGCSGLVNGAKQTIQAAFQLNPTSVNFGKVAVGKQTTQPVSVANTGNTTVSITQATFSNPQFSCDANRRRNSHGHDDGSGQRRKFARDGESLSDSGGCRPTNFFK